VRTPREEAIQLDQTDTDDLNICPVSGEPCPLDINLEVLRQQHRSPEERAALESIKRLVAVKRRQDDCRDGEHETVENSETTIHCDLNDVASVIRGARQIGNAFGLDDEIIELTPLNKVSEHKKREWKYGEEGRE
jgi:hypothetical protein